MNFPEINHIDDVLPHIANKPEFIVAERDGYKVINYTVAFEDTFDGDPILRECRGLVFDADGKLISRRLHKFFNLNEREDTKMEVLPWDQTYYIMDKLDGSMITPLLINGYIRWGTKMGLTDVAIPVEEHIDRFGGAQTHNNKYFQFAHSLMSCGYTPIFEWCSNKQRIVIDHPEDKLVLLHIRHNINGTYLSRSAVNDMAMQWNIPVVRTWIDTFNPDELVKTIREIDDGEGIVIQFGSGEMVKVKSDWYIRIHRAKDKIATDRRLLECILNNELDDLLPILSNEDRLRIHDFEYKFETMVYRKSAGIVLELEHLHYHNMTRKDFALDRANECSAIVRTSIFKFYDQTNVSIQDVETFLLNMIRNSFSSEAKFAEMRKQLEF